MDIVHGNSILLVALPVLPCGYIPQTHSTCEARVEWVDKKHQSDKMFCSKLLLTTKGAARGGAEGAQAPLGDQNIDVYFVSFSPTLYCKSRSRALQNVLWQSHRRSNTFVIKPCGYEFSRFEKNWSSFLCSCVVCTTIYNKSWVLTCSAIVEASLTFELPTVSIEV